MRSGLRITDKKAVTVRSFSRDDIFQCGILKNIIGNSSTSAMIATFIEQEEDISELERIEELIRKRMKELEEAQ